MEIIKSTITSRPCAVIGTFVALSVLYYLFNAICNVYFHPLRHIPGPRLSAISRIPWIRHVLAGTTVIRNKELHDKYGEVVRFTPNEVSFSSGETAWPDIYGFRTGKLKGHLNMQKDPMWYPRPVNGVPSILVADDEGHGKGRKILSHAFSERALLAQEDLLQGYVDQLISRLKEVSSASKEAIDMVKWYNWTTFDIIADLMFGEPFGCLQNLTTHKYITLLFESVEAGRLSYIMGYFPILQYLGPYLGIIDTKLIQKRKEYSAWVATQTEKRCARDTQRPDFMTHILAHNGKDRETALTPDHIASNAELILTAGSETTATLLSGVTFSLLQNPAVYQQLKNEIRGRWATYEEISLEEVNKAPYLLAVLSESLRYFPPVPVGFERRTAAGGEFVSGYYVPENTAVSVSQYAAGRSEDNFRDADLFIPERWMGAERYKNDKRSAAQPFSFGPRACLGKSLAYAEMRMILAKIVWSFDMELDSRSKDWNHECKCTLLWKKPELAVHIREVTRK